MTFCCSPFMPPTGWWSILIAITHSWSNIWMCTLKEKRSMCNEIERPVMVKFHIILPTTQRSVFLVYLPVYRWNQCDRLGRLWLCYWSWFWRSSLRDSLSTLWKERITQILAVCMYVGLCVCVCVKSFTIPKMFPFVSCYPSISPRSNEDTNNFYYSNSKNSVLTFSKEVSKASSF